MAFAIDGGIEWEKDEDNQILTIRATTSPEAGYTIGQMKDYDSIGPWGTIGKTYTLVLDNGITSIGANAFNGCSGFTGSLTIPDSVTSIGQFAFWNCFGFTDSLTIGNNVVSIKWSAFQGCGGFTGSLTIPDSVTSIGGTAFGDCSGFSGSLTIGKVLHQLRILRSLIAIRLARCVS